MLRRIIANTLRLISRSGWTAWASISVMTLAFLLGSIFGGLAYVSNLYIKYIESKSNILVFFEVGMDKVIIDNLKTKWSNDSRIKSITYESEEDAYKHFSDVASTTYKEEYDVLKNWKDKKLQSNLDIQIYSLSDLSGLKNLIENDIETQNKKLVIIDTSAALPSSNSLSSATSSISASNSSSITTTSRDQQNANITMYKYSRDPSQKPIFIKVDDKSLDQLRQVFYSIRIAGIAILTLLFIVIFFFTFMTVEFRLYNQMEEIGVMQLVGGSLLFIRSPYVLEGGIYGLIGALISSFIIGSILIGVFILNSSSAIAVFIYNYFNVLPWPHVTKLGWVGVILILSFIGFLIGSLSSYLSIRRYIR